MNPENVSIEFDTGAQSPLIIVLTETDIRGDLWPDNQPRVTIVQDESDTFYGSNLTLEQAGLLREWLESNI